MKQIIQHILEIPFFRNILKLSVSSVVNMTIAIIVTPILSRIYSPEDYGEWGVFSSVVMIVTSFIFLSYENAVVKETDKVKLPSIIYLCLTIATIIIGLTCSIFFIGRWLQIAFFINFPSLTLLIIALCLSAIDILCSNISNRYSRYNIMSIVGVVMGVSQAGSRLVFGIIPIAKGLILGNILSIFLKVILYLKNIKSVIKKDILRIASFKSIQSVAVDNKKFPLFDAPARFVEFVIGNIVIIILSVYYDMTEIGCYSMISQLVQIPLSLMGTSMSTVYFKDLSVVSTDRIKLKQLTFRTVRVCFFMSVLPAAFLAFGGDYLLVLFLGDKWELAGQMSLCLAVFSIPVILSEPLLPIFKVLDKQDYRFWLNIANLIIAIGALYCGIFLDYNVITALLLYSIGYAIVRFVMFWCQMKLSGVNLKDCSREICLIGLLYIILSFRLAIII